MKLWVHAGQGGAWGWGGPLSLHVAPEEAKPARVTLGPEITGRQLQERWTRPVVVAGARSISIEACSPSAARSGFRPSEALWRDEGGYGPPARPRPHGSIRTPRGPGLGPGTRPDSLRGRPDHLPDRRSPGWHWDVWVRYGTDMKPFGQPGVSGNHTLTADASRAGAAPGSAEHRKLGADDMVEDGGTPAHARPAHADVDEREGGRDLARRLYPRPGSNLHADMSPPPASGPDRIVFQAEDCDTFVTKEGELPGGDRAAVWLSGDGARLDNLTVLGTPEVNIGVAHSVERPGRMGVRPCSLRGQGRRYRRQAGRELRGPGPQRLEVECPGLRAVGPHAALPFRGAAVRVPGKRPGPDNPLRREFRGGDPGPDRADRGMYLRA